MSNYIVNNIPFSNRKDFGYKAINSSTVHNQNQDEILNDILDLYNKTNSIEKVINEQLDYIKLENSTLESIYLALYNKYKDLYQRYEAMLNIKDDKRYIATAQDCTVFDDEFGAVIDNIACDITVRPSKKVSKFVIFDSITDSVYIPDTLNVSVQETNTKGIISAINNDLYAPFYKDNNLYWTRKVVTDNTVEQIETEYIINLAEDIMTTFDMNEIFISPFLCRVKSVYGRFGDSNIWELISGQENHDAIKLNTGTLGYINNNRPFRLNFPNTKVNQLKIVLVSSNYTEGETNLRTFSFGLKQLGAYINYYNDYEPNTFQFDVSLKDNKGLTITDVTPYFNNAVEFGRYSKDFVCDIYYKDTSGYYHKIVDSFPFVPPTEDIRVRCKFGKNLKEANVKYVELKYKSNFKLPPEIDINEIKQIESKGSHVVALKLDGSVWTWGSNQAGQLTNSTNLYTWQEQNTTPIKIKELSDVKEISTGLDYTLALKKDGTIWSFGDNFYGQLGNANNIGTHEPNTVPSRIRNLINIVHVSAGSWHAVAVNTLGEVFTWGYNYYGQLGREENIGTHEPSYIPTKVDGLSAIVNAEAGFWHTTALKSDNTMYSWGYNESGQLGYQTDNEANFTPKIMNIF